MQYLVFPLVMGIVDTIEKKYHGKPRDRISANAMSVSCIMLLLTTLLYLQLAGFYTVSDSKKMLVDKGFEDPLYVTHYREMYWVDVYDIDNISRRDYKDKDDRLGAYYFEATKDGKKYRIFVDVESGELIRQVEFEK